MSAWIKVEHTTPDKPEVIKMAAMLRIDPDAVTGKLIRVWIWADANTVDGSAVPATMAFIDRHTHCKRFAAAMRDVGWLTGEDGALHFPEFDRHNGNSAKARAETARRVANHRKSNTVTVTHVTPNALQKPLPEKEKEKESIPLPPCAGVPWTEADFIVQIARAYGKPGNIDLLAPLIQASLDKLQGDPIPILRGTEQATEVIMKYAPAGMNSEFVPSAKNFFAEEQWKHPEAFASYWKPTGKSSNGSKPSLPPMPRGGFSVAASIAGLTPDEILGPGNCQPKKP